MLRSYKFDSRAIEMQEVEQNPQKLPFEIAEPAGDTLKLAAPPMYAVKITRDTRATRSMMFLWTGDVTGGGEGYRVIGTGAEGTMRFPRALARAAPGNLTVRLYGMNANGKVYSLLR